MKCTRCGVTTKRNALSSEADDVENSENGVVWLCDTCTKLFDDWLGEDVFKTEVEMSDFEELLEKAVENINQANKHRVRNKDVEAIPILLQEAEAYVERARTEFDNE